MAEKLASKIASLGAGSKTAVVQASVVEKAGQQTLVDTALNLSLHQNIICLLAHHYLHVHCEGYKLGKKAGKTASSIVTRGKGAKHNGVRYCPILEIDSTMAS